MTELRRTQLNRLYDEFDFEDYETITSACIDKHNCVHIEYVDERDDSIGDYHSGAISDWRIDYIIYGKKY